MWQLLIIPIHIYRLKYLVWRKFFALKIKS
jgi:hypothetical protein